MRRGLVSKFVLMLGLILGLGGCNNAADTPTSAIVPTPTETVAILPTTSGPSTATAQPTSTLVSSATQPVSTGVTVATTTSAAGSPTAFIIVAPTPTPERIIRRTDAPPSPTNLPAPSATPQPTVTQVVPLAGGPDSEEQRFLQLLNAYRQANGRGPLSFDPQLFQSARWMAQDMAGKTQVSHTDSQGRDIFKRIKDFGYPGRWVGENIAGGFEQAEDNLKIWQSDDIHKNNLLGPNYTRAAAGRYHANAAFNSWFWVLDLG